MFETARSAEAADREDRLRKRASVFWPILAVVLGGVAYAMGYADKQSIATTLGIESLSTALPKEEYLLNGMLLLLEFLSASLIAVAIVACTRTVSRTIPWKIRIRVRNVVTGFLRNRDHRLRPSIAVALMLVGAGIEYGFRNYLPGLKHIPLRSSPDVPLFGVRGLLSSDGSFALGLVFLVGAGIAFWILAAFAAFERLQWGQFRTVFATYCVLVLIVILLDWSKVHGAAATIDAYPVVAGPASEKIFEPDSLCLRLAADDSEVAMFCVIFRGTDYEHSKKSLVFLPRAAYPWRMEPLRQPLYQMAFVKWLAAYQKSHK